MMMARCMWFLSLLSSPALLLSVDAAEINFEGLTPGEIVHELTEGNGVTGTHGGSIAVMGHIPSFMGNSAVVFDSSNPTGGDNDLGSPNQEFTGPGVDEDPGDNNGGEATSVYANSKALGNVLINNEADGLEEVPGNSGMVADPDDSDESGQYFTFDFTGLKRGKTVTINSISYLDIEAEEGEGGAKLEMFGPKFPSGGTMITLNAVGDNGYNEINDIGMEGVTHIKVTLNGSGALAAISFDEELERECWVTTGGFVNSGEVSGPKGCTFGGNIGPPSSGAFEVNFHDGELDGAKFHTNDIVVVECYSDNTDTGPQQPGGNKGFDIDRLDFSCSGRFNNASGYTCSGYLIDAGEPSGKKENDKDMLVMEIRDSEQEIVATCEGKLDGGNVQLHPPVGKPE